MGGPQPPACERSLPGARRPPVGYQDPATSRAPGPARSPNKGREFRVSQPTALGPQPGPERLLPSTASQCQRKRQGAGPHGHGRAGERSAGGAPGGGVPGAGRHRDAGRRIISLESPESTLRPEMTASKRVAKELENLQNELPPYLCNLSSDDNNVLVWHAVLLPKKPPYNLKAFNLLISFPEGYPLMPPTVMFTTKIYHPNVDSSGRVCLPIISKENWKPNTKISQVLEALSVLVNRPELEQPVRVELADLLAQDPELFYREAEEFTLKFGENRPS